MNVLIVCNNAYNKGNGLCTAILKLKEELTGRGLDARIMASSNPDPNGPKPDFELRHFKFPFFEKLVYSNGFRYARADKNQIKKAFAWADVIHFEEGFPMEVTAMKIAQKMNKPCVGSFHLYSENIMANLGMKDEWLFNHLITKWWRDGVYNKCKIVHCPTQSVKDHLLSRGYKAELRVFSNGISIDGDIPVSERSTDPFVILCIGRLSNEKSQTTLLEAMRYSKYANKIQLKFAGKGPKEKKYRRLAGKLVKDGTLSYEPTFGFYDQSELEKVASHSYLYIHCAVVEVEGLSCLEAMRCGAVPVIAKGHLVATSQFALDERSIFPAGDAKALAEKIDWWIEHPQERDKMSAEYAASAKKYDIRHSTDKMIQMYEDALK